MTERTNIELMREILELENRLANRLKALEARAQRSRRDLFAAAALAGYRAAGSCDENDAFGIRHAREDADAMLAELKGKP